MNGLLSFRHLRPGRLLALTAALMAVPALALAAEPTPADNAAAIDTAWVLIAAFLVMFMHPGFAMVEAGFTRAKNAVNICLKNVFAFAMGSLAYWAFGFAIMFGVSAGGFMGTTGFFGAGSFDHLGLGIPVLAFFLFQMVFANTAATIVSGAVAERIRFFTFMVFAGIMTAFIYPVVGHWIWNGEGWLANLGFLDFAGSTVVHSVGAWAALIGAILLGPRLGKFGKDGSINAIPGHNMTLATLGVLILWFGWFGFNPGSTLAATDPNIARIALNTNLAAAAGATVAILLGRLSSGKPNLGLALNGALAGLVGITAPCAFVTPGAAVLIGAIAGVLIGPALSFFDRIKVDDPVGAISVHGVAGIWGTLAVGLFHEELGLLTTGQAAQLGIQAVGIIAVLAWTTAAALVGWMIVRAVLGMRVSPDEEVRGLDLEEHGTVAYPDFQATEALATRETAL